MNRILLASLLIVSFAARAAAGGPDPYDRLYDDGTSSTLNEVAINIPQSHAISGADDWDWATFNAEAGMPYSVKLQAVGADVDVEMFVFLDGPGHAGVSTDMAAYGGAETYSRLSWPSTGRFWVAVHAAAWRAGATSYTLTVTRNTGANLGLATISSTKMAEGGPNAGSVQVPRTLSLSDGSTTVPLYTQIALNWQAGTFTSGTTELVLLGGLGDPSNSLASPHVARWLELFPHNLTITRVGLDPAVQPLKPLALTMQMIAQPVTLDLSDGATTLPNFVARDVPQGSRPDQVRVWHWSKSAGDWRVVDAAPAVTQQGASWLVTTNVSHLDLDIAGSDYFAVAIQADTSGATGWTKYR